MSPSGSANPETNSESVPDLAMVPMMMAMKLVSEQVKTPAMKGVLDMRPDHSLYVRISISSGKPDLSTL